MPKHYDTIIIGAGLVGSVQALILAGAGLNVLILERFKLEPQKNAEDGRGLALTHASLQVLKNAGLYEELEPFFTPIHDIRVSEEATYHHLHFSHTLVHNTAMGVLIRASKLRQIIHETLLKTPSVTVMDDFLFEKFEDTCSFVHIEGQGHIFRTPLVIAADGKNSAIREKLGI
jgi:2-octaprenyl-6-methoxyphenol hydroxylase